MSRKLYGIIRLDKIVAQADLVLLSVFIYADFHGNKKKEPYPVFYLNR